MKEDLNPEKKEKCLILGCGPSLNEITESDIKNLSKDHIIATIKQSYLKFGDYSDFQFFNCNNLVKYERKKAKFIYCSPHISPFLKQQEVDYTYKMSEFSPNRKLCHFDDLNDFFSIENMGKYFGPGIIFEIVLPFIYNLGVKKIITAGWDFHKNEKEIEHFYEEKNRKSFSNPARIPYDGENEESIKNSKKVNSFLTSKGISLYCLDSDKCFLDDSIERIKL
jgi:hypothetical protein